MSATVYGCFLAKMVELVVATNVWLASPKMFTVWPTPSKTIFIHMCNTESLRRKIKRIINSVEFQA